MPSPLNFLGGPPPKLGSGGGGESYAVTGGVGMLSGGPGGAAARTLMGTHGVRVSNADGIGGNPYFDTLNTTWEVGSGIIDATLGQQQLFLEGEMQDCEFHSIVLSRFTASQAVVNAIRAGFYIAPKYAADGTPSASGTLPGAAAELVPVGTLFSWVGGNRALQFKLDPPIILEPVVLYYIPQTAAASACRFSVSVRGHPTWKRAIAGL